MYKNYYCVEIPKTDNLFISNGNPPVRKIINTSMRIKVISSEILNSHSDKKLVINGLKLIKITYKPINSHRGKAKIYYEIPFSTLVSLDAPTEIYNISFCIESISVFLVDPTHISICTILSLYNHKNRRKEHHYYLDDYTDLYNEYKHNYVKPYKRSKDT